MKRLYLLISLLLLVVAVLLIDEVPIGKAQTLPGPRYEFHVEDYTVPGDGDPSSASFDWLPVFIRLMNSNECAPVRPTPTDPGAAPELNRAGCKIVLANRHYRLSGPLDVCKQMDIGGSGGQSVSPATGGVPATNG